MVCVCAMHLHAKCVMLTKKYVDVVVTKNCSTEKCDYCSAESEWRVTGIN